MWTRMMRTARIEFQRSYLTFKARYEDRYFTLMGGANLLPTQDTGSLQRSEHIKTKNVERSAGTEPWIRFCSGFCSGKRA